jgi:phosphoribosylformylglycinamidine synthase
MGVPFAVLGETVSMPSVTIAAPAQHLHLSVNLQTLKTAWEEPLKDILA